MLLSTVAHASLFVYINEGEQVSPLHFSQMLRVKRNFVSSQANSVPLKQVIVEARLQSFAADVTIKQIFCNNESTPIEAVYCFPIEEQAAVYAFVARIGDREIVTQLREKEEAQQRYNDALRQGHGALLLLEQDKKSQDKFIINVGALPAGEECHTSISYVTELDLVQNGRKIRFVVPTTIAPRYNPDPDKGGITAPANTNAKYVQASPYTIEFRRQVEKRGVKGVSSISHPIEVDLSCEDAFIVTLAQEKTHLDRDILLDIDLAETRSNTIIAVEAGAVMASFTPIEEECRRAMNKVDTNNEFIFVIGCSGSMEDEGKIGLARQAMLLFLKSLPMHCHFNILRFGSTHQTLSNQITVVYNEENVLKAEQWIHQISVELNWSVSSSPRILSSLFSLLVESFAMARETSTSTRSRETNLSLDGWRNLQCRSLVKDLARATNGRFVFIPPGSQVDIYDGEQLQKALQVSLSNVQIRWNLGTVVTSVPEKIPPIYANDRLILYALLLIDPNPYLILMAMPSCTPTSIDSVK